MTNTFDPDFGSALEAAAAIRSKAISSVELTEHTLARIDVLEPRLNAYAYRMRDQALAAATRADEALARDEVTGVFHGVPINVKESFGVEGQPCTWGSVPLKDMRASKTATPVRRLLDAGAILLGATNVPFALMDAQSYNGIYGVSNNPWDITRTPGGSSGGSAASLAAGTAFLSLGSDIGGSIRTPASFCGIYGHKPTLDIVPMTGHAPGGVRSPAGFSTLLSVAGPMARSAEDLEASLVVLAGPERPDAKAFQWTLPKARHENLRDYRIGFLFEDPAVPVCRETRAVLEETIRVCEKAGASLREGWPPDFSFRELLENYLFHLGAFEYSMQPPAAQARARAEMQGQPPSKTRGALSGFAEWQVENRKRLVYRALWERYFEEVDVFLLPTVSTAAFRHDHGPINTRTISLPGGGTQPYWNLITYICPASLTGCPATTAPVGLSKSGLPVGVQIVAPFHEDATSIRFAQLLARELGGFRAPGFANMAA